MMDVNHRTCTGGGVGSGSLTTDDASGLAGLAACRASRSVSKMMMPIVAVNARPGGRDGRVRARPLGMLAKCQLATVQAVSSFLTF